jgi:hypothetical protein
MPATSKTQQCKRLQQLQHRKRLVAIVAGYATAVITTYFASHLFKTPQNTSIFTGHQWVQELLASHPRRFHNMMGMSKHVFIKLLSDLQVHAGLSNTRHIAREE